MEPNLSDLTKKLKVGHLYLARYQCQRSNLITGQIKNRKVCQGVKRYEFTLRVDSYNALSQLSQMAYEV